MTRSSVQPSKDIPPQTHNAQCLDVSTSCTKGCRSFMPPSGRLYLTVLSMLLRQRWEIQISWWYKTDLSMYLWRLQALLHATSNDNDTNKTQDLRRLKSERRKHLSGVTTCKTLPLWRFPCFCLSNAPIVTLIWTEEGDSQSLVPFKRTDWYRWSLTGSVLQCND